MTLRNLKDNLQFEVRYADPESQLFFKKELVFKLVFIKRGDGIVQFQNNHFPYLENDLFIVPMGEGNISLSVGTTTKLLIVKFSGLFISVDGTDYKSSIFHFLQYANHIPDYVQKIRNNSPLVRQLASTIMAETNDIRATSLEYISQLVHTLLIIISENIKASLPERINSVDQKTLEMLHYIHQNIFDPAKLTTDELGKKFFISPTYVGRYFKKYTGQCLHKYILLYKTKLIENRLLNSTSRICEIADEFGFADKSYLNKFFFKMRGVSPSVFRNKRTKINTPA